MFTGIVQGTASIVEVHELDAFRTHVVALPPEMREGLEIGASVAHNGVCLTVTAIEGDNVSFDLMRETLRLTNLGALEPGGARQYRACCTVWRRDWGAFDVRPYYLYGQRRRDRRSSQ